MKDIKFRFIYQDNNGDLHKIYATLEVLMMEGLNLNNLIKDFGEIRIISKDLYTGLKDKNGKEIYNGDIIKIYKTDYEKNDYKNCIGIVEWCDTCCHGFRWQMIGASNNENLARFLDREIIGNIYEDSRLLL